MTTKEELLDKIADATRPNWEIDEIEKIAETYIKNEDKSKRYDKLMKWLKYNYDFEHDLNMPKNLQKSLSES